MKTGVVFEINNNKAVIMLAGGSFVSIDAKAGWSKGDVVSVKNDHFSMKALYAAAACFIFIFLFGIGGYKLYFTQTSLVSIDINPSIEIGLNRFDRVISVSGLNDDGIDILGSVNLLHKKYLDAFDALMESEALAHYLAADEVWVMFAVQSDMPDRNGILSDALNNEVESLSMRYSALKSDCQIVSREFVSEAHAHGLTPRKYYELLKLKELMPEISIDDYRDMSIREIMKEIEQISGETNNGNGNGYGNGNGRGNGNQGSPGGGTASESPATTDTPGSGNGQGNGNQGSSGGSAAASESSATSDTPGNGNGQGNGNQGSSGGAAASESPASTDTPGSGSDQGRGNQGSSGGSATPEQSNPTSDDGSGSDNSGGSGNSGGRGNGGGVNNDD